MNTINHSKFYSFLNSSATATELLQATLDSSQDMIQVFEAVRNEEGEIVDFIWALNNHTSERIYGDIVGKRLLEHNPGVVAEGIFDAFVQVVETGVPQQYERHYVHEEFNGWFYQSVVKLGDGVATTTADITARKKAEQEVLRLKDEVAQKTTDKYRTLFNTMEEGLCVFEIIYNEHDKPVDLRLLEVNPAFDKITGLKNVAGKLTSEFIPTEPHWLDTYDRVVKTGEPLRYESYQAGNKQWYRTHTSRIGGAESRIVANVFEDITEHKLQEQQQQYLLKLTDSIRSISDAVQIQTTAVRMIAEELGADIAHFSEVSPDERYSTIHWDYRRHAHIPSVAGTYDLQAFAVSMQHSKDGLLVIADVEACPYFSAEEKAAYTGVGVRASLFFTFFKKGKRIAHLTVSQSTPREWSDFDIALVRETAERTWVAVERAKAEEALRKSEEKFRVFVTASSDMVYRVSADWSEMYLLKGKNLLADTEETITNWREKYIPVEELPFVEAAVEVAIRTKSTFSHEHRVKLADGSTGWVFSRAVPILDENGAITEWLGAASDITARKKAEQQLLEFNELLEQQVAERTRELATEHYFLEQVTDKTPLLIYVYDLEEGRFTYINKRVEDLIGRDQEYVYAMGPHLFQAVLHPEDVLRRAEYMGGLKTLNPAEVREIEFRIWNGRAFRWFRSRDSIFWQEAGAVKQVIGIAEDITYEKMMQEKNSPGSGPLGLN